MIRGLAALDVRKSYKLFIDGKFPRSESGRSYSLVLTSKSVANLSRASRKDFRDAVGAARKAFPGWSAQTPMLRGQMIYRLAEMMSGRFEELVSRVQECTAYSESEAKKEVQETIDYVIGIAGWSDKWQALLGTVNPVAGPYFNISYQEPMGVVGIIAPKRAPLLGMVSEVLSSVISGNTAVVLAEEVFGPIAVTGCEMIATSDIPAGVINMLTGIRTELMEHFYTHMDVNAVGHSDAHADLESEKFRTWLTPEKYNLKRWITHSELGSLNPDQIGRFTEVKTVWHPSAL